jgi:hypothetical protein
MRKSFPLIQQTELRLALTAGLSAGLVICLGLPDAMYAPMTVAAALGGTMGSSWTLGVQRIEGTLLGGLIVVVAHGGIGTAMPMPIGIAIALACTRLFGGSLGLRSGYKVAGLVVVMGWTVHGSSLASWLPLRLLVTMIGILLSLLAINCFWPSRALAEHQRLSRLLFNQFASVFIERADQMASGVDMDAQTKRQRRDGLIKNLLELQNQRPAAKVELGTDGAGEHYLRLWDLEEQFFGELIGYYRTLLRLPMVPMEGTSLEAVLTAEVNLLRQSAQLLCAWANHWPEGRPKNTAALGKGQQWPWEEALVQAEQELFKDPASSEIMLQKGRGRRAMLCQQLAAAMGRFEQSWTSLA